MTAKTIQHNNAARWLKFNAVGGVGILVQLGVLAALVSGLRMNYIAATALAVEAAILHNFFWHERFTWADRIRNAERSFIRLVKFNLTTGCFSIGGNLLLMRVLAGELGLNYLLANLMTIASCSLANFLVSDRIVFGKCGADTHVRGFPR